jgi:tRNA pseudouridine55 synthase
LRNVAQAQARRLFNAEKAGHTGSLDPAASGMLPICFGQATKLSGQLLGADKHYVAVARFGQRTRTGDAEGEVIETRDTHGLDWAALENVRERFVGAIEQIPPMYSALKHQGRRLYQLARAGQEVARAPRSVHIRALSWRPLGAVDLEVSVRCSKGTYIRTLIEDLAAAIGQCAHLQSLRRTEAQPFGGLPMWTLDELSERAQRSQADLDAALQPLAVAVRHWPQVVLQTCELRRLLQGQVAPVMRERLPPGVVAGMDVAVMDPAGALMALAHFDPASGLAPRRWLGATRSLETGASDS